MEAFEKWCKQQPPRRLRDMIDFNLAGDAFRAGMLAAADILDQWADVQDERLDAYVKAGNPGPATSMGGVSRSDANRIRQAADSPIPDAKDNDPEQE